MANATANNQFNHAPAWEGLKRFLEVVPAGLAITLLLILGMERLIYSEPIDVPEPPERIIPDPVMEPREPPPVERDTPVKPKPPELVPETPDLNFEVATKIEHANQPVAPNRERVTPTIAYSSDAPIATVLVQPNYPARALARGIEGYVDVLFDVTEMGTTTNIQVTGALPERIFNSAAVRAVQNWKFQPVTVEGKPRPFQGMQQRLTFQMAE